MAIDPKLLVIKPVNELESVTGLQAGELLFYDGSNNLKKIDIDTFNNLSKTAKPLKPTDATPTVDGLYIPTVSGTYANAGGLIAQEGYYTLFFFNGTTWTKSESKFPQAPANLRLWSALPFSKDEQVVKDSVIYIALENVLDTDVPGVSAKWKSIGGSGSGGSESNGIITPSTPEPIGGWKVGFYEPKLSSPHPGTNYPFQNNEKSVDGYYTRFFFDGTNWSSIARLNSDLGPTFVDFSSVVKFDQKKKITSTTLTQNTNFTLDNSVLKPESFYVVEIFPNGFTINISNDFTKKIDLSIDWQKPISIIFYNPLLSGIDIKPLAVVTNLGDINSNTPTVEYKVNDIGNVAGAQINSFIDYIKFPDRVMTGEEMIYNVGYYVDSGTEYMLGNFITIPNDSNSRFAGFVIPMSSVVAGQEYEIPQTVSSNKLLIKFLSAVGPGVFYPSGTTAFKLIEK